MNVNDNPYAPPRADIEQAPVIETGLNPWLHIWIRPRAVMRQLLATESFHYVPLLACIGGIYQAFNQSDESNLGDTLALPALLGVVLVGGVASGFLILLVGGAMLRWTGSWLGGRGKGVEVRAALAWSNAPLVWLLPLLALQLLLFGHELFTSTSSLLAGSQMLVLALLGMGVIELVVGIWAVVILFQCLGEAHRFSAWKALLSFIVAAAVVIIPALLLAIGFAEFNQRL